MSSVTEREVGFVEACRMALADSMEADPAVFILGEDVADEEGGGVLKVTQGLSTKFGTDRVRSTPISEQAIMGAAVGSAIAGMRPVAEIMLMNFMTVAMDQLFNHAAKLRFMSGGQIGVPLTVRTTTGAGTGFGAQHSDMLEAWLAHSPGLKVVMPSSPADAYGLLYSCIFDDDPCVVIEHSLLYYSPITGPAPTPGARIPLGKASILAPGTDVSVITYGKAVRDCLALVAPMAELGISAEIIDLRTIAPFDRDTILESVGRTKRAVVVHEAVKRHGVGAEIAAMIHAELFGELIAPVARVGSRFCPVPFASTIEQAFLYNAEDISDAIVETMRR